MQKSKLHIAILLLIVVQSIISLSFPVYHDIGWVKDTWFGNDLVTLIVFVPVFIYSIFSKSSFSKIILLGCFGYLIYNYLFYLLGCSLNKLFIVYNLIVVLSIIALVKYVFYLVSEKVIPRYFNVEDRNYLTIAIFLFIGTGLGLVWIGKWFSYSYFGAELPSEEPVFRLVASLDITFMVSGFILSAVLMVKRKIGGYILCAIIGFQGFLYLMVLLTNSVIFSFKSNSLHEELPIWGSLLLTEGIGLFSFYKKFSQNSSTTDMDSSNIGKTIKMS